MRNPCIHSVFFFNDTATTEIYTLSLHDALPILHKGVGSPVMRVFAGITYAPDRRDRDHDGVPDVDDKCPDVPEDKDGFQEDRKSTRLNSSHSQISYAVFCLKKNLGSIRTQVRRR